MKAARGCTAARSPRCVCPAIHGLCFGTKVVTGSAMTNGRGPMLALAFVLLLSAGCARSITGFEASSTEASRPAAVRDLPLPVALHEAYARIPLHFEEHRGDAGSGARFIARGPGYGVSLEPDGATLVLASGRVRVRFAASAPSPSLVGRDELPGRVNYAIGRDPARWRMGVPTYERIEYRGVYPGIDVAFYGRQRELEYDVIVAPGADPRRIALCFDGAEPLAVADNGDLVVGVAGGRVVQRAPHLYQERDGRRVAVEGG